MWLASIRLLSYPSIVPPELFRQARCAGLTVSLDTGCDPDGVWGDEELLTLLRSVDIFLPNEDEARALARVDDTEKALCELAKRARLVVVKGGAFGAMSLHNGQIVHSPGFEVDVVETTGTGDSFNAGFIPARLSLEEALRSANACGALSTTGSGGTAAQATQEQVLTFLETRSR